MPIKDGCVLDHLGTSDLSMFHASVGSEVFLRDSFTVDHTVKSLGKLEVDCVKESSFLMS